MQRRRLPREQEAPVQPEKKQGFFSGMVSFYSNALKGAVKKVKEHSQQEEESPPYE